MVTILAKMLINIDKSISFSLIKTCLSQKQKAYKKTNLSALSVNAEASFLLQKESIKKYN